jgi:hypothetical protein
MLHLVTPVFLSLSAWLVVLALFTATVFYLDLLGWLKLAVAAAHRA